MIASHPRFASHLASATVVGADEGQVRRLIRALAGLNEIGDLFQPVLSLLRSTERRDCLLLALIHDFLIRHLVDLRLLCLLASCQHAQLTTTSAYLSSAQPCQEARFFCSDSYLFLNSR